MQIPILNGPTGAAMPMQAARFYVYEHRRHDTGAVFYIGKGQGKRAYVSSRHHRSAHWQRIVAKAGGFSVSFVAEGMDEELAFLAERERIDQARRVGVSLCNQTDGGDGTSGWVKTEEWRQKVGAAHRGKILSQETRAKISEAVAAAGYRHSEETRRRMANARIGKRPGLGRKQPIEERLRRGLAAIGNKSRTGQKRSAEERAKASAAMTGRGQQKISCPHCACTGGNAMHRWHFDNCRSKP